jgi:hypothetical protein
MSDGAPDPKAATGVTDVMVCVYYRVAAPDLAAAIATARDIQRGLSGGDRRIASELLLRSGHPSHGEPAMETPPTAATSPVRQAQAEATLMEIYRLDAHPGEPSLAAFLARLAEGARALSPLLRSDRHVEVFRPCVS